MKIKHNKKLVIAMSVLGAGALLLLFQQPALSQGGKPFDLANLRSINPALTTAYTNIKIIEAWEEIISSGQTLSEVIPNIISS